jgi:hypothetical protein
MVWSSFAGRTEILFVGPHRKVVRKKRKCCSVVANIAILTRLLIETSGMDGNRILVIIDGGAQRKIRG